MKIAVIGGGAAGFFAAIHAADQSNHDVVLFESTAKLLSKVRISGGGRCNVTHACFNPAELCEAYPRGGKELRQSFSRFMTGDTVRWFEEHGVELKTESDGRMFPRSDDSASIVDCLFTAAEDAGVEIRTGDPVDALVKKPDGFSIDLR
ncbi:MAG: NAD(P)/FAD-dependent oxidoreductase, partial [Flavobacteriales bacterium]